MPFEKIFLSLLPIPLFYLIYYRYFRLKSDMFEHIQSFLAGVALALIIMLVSPWLGMLFNHLGLGNTAPVEGFIKAAFVEKIGALILVLMLHRRYPGFTIVQATLSAMTLGIGFAMVENVFYAISFGYGVILIRVIYSVPLHLTTCGILGYYMGMRTFCSTGSYRTIFMLRAFLYPFVLHGAFDTLILEGGTTAYVSAPLLIVMVIILEYLLAKAQGLVPHDILMALKIRFEEWLSIYRQPRFDRWIIQSMGMPSISPVHLFLWRPGILRFILVILGISAALMGLSYRDEILAWLNLLLRKEEEIMILGVFPASISLILILVGAINPRFFKESEMRIPIISDVEIAGPGGREETLVTYDLNSANCFLKTSEPLGLGTKIEARFVFSGYSSPLVPCSVVWENHEDRQEPMGSVAVIEKSGRNFTLFYLRYLFFRYRKGIAFNLKLPGFEMTRRLFMRPITTMQDDRVYRRAEKIFLEGEHGDEFYLLKKGRILFYKAKNKDGDIITMESIGPGQIFGEMAIVRDSGRAATAICLTDCIVAVANKDNMDALIKNNPDFALNLIRTLTERLQMSEKIMMGAIENLQGENVEKRTVFLAAAIMAMHKTEGQSDLDPESVTAFVKGLGPARAIDIVVDKILGTNSQGNTVTATEISEAFQKIYDLYREYISARY